MEISDRYKWLRVPVEKRIVYATRNDFDNDAEFRSFPVFEFACRPIERSIENRTLHASKENKFDDLPVGTYVYLCFVTDVCKRRFSSQMRVFADR